MSPENDELLRLEALKLALKLEKDSHHTVVLHTAIQFAKFLKGEIHE
jgi:hypothetical protein